MVTMAAVTEGYQKCQVQHNEATQHKIMTHKGRKHKKRLKLFLTFFSMSLIKL